MILQNLGFFPMCLFYVSMFLCGSILFIIRENDGTKEHENEEVTSVMGVWKQHVATNNNFSPSQPETRDSRHETRPRDSPHSAPCYFFLQKIDMHQFSAYISHVTHSS